MPSGWSTAAVLLLLAFYSPPALGGGTDPEAQGELEAVKERILAALGLQRVPDMSKANVSAAEMNRMVRLYERSVLESEREEAEEDAARGPDPSVLRFHSYPAYTAASGKSFRHPENKSSQVLFFHLHTSSSLGSRAGPSLQSAKLRIPGRTSSPVGQPGGQRPRVHIYRLLESPSSHNVTRVLVSSRSASPGSPYVAEVDISDTVRHWIENPGLNFGLEVECYGCDVNRTETPFRTDAANVSAAVVDERDASAVLDVLVSESSSRSKRSNPLHSSRTRLDCSRGFETKKCCRRSLLVSFKEIGWDWIVHPLEFEAFYCKGRCHNRVNNFASSHALVQSILSRKRRKVPRPCCAPLRLKPLELLHYTDGDPPNLVITKQKGMIVKECACA